MSKRFLTVIVGLMLCFAFMPAIALAQTAESGSPLLVAATFDQVSDEVAAQADEAPSGTWGTCPWTISDGVLTIGPGEGENISDIESNYASSPWKQWQGSITSVVFKAEGDQKVVAPEKIPFLLYRLYKVTSIDFSGLDVSNTKNISYMLAGCMALETVDLSPLKASNVTHAKNVFSGCTKLESVNLGFLSGAPLVNINSMFGSSSFYYLSGCTALTTVDLTPLDTSRLDSLNSVFEGCTALESVNMTSLETSNIGDLTMTFSGCKSLATITGFDKLNLKNVNSLYYTFDGCAALPSVNLDGMRDGSVKMYASGLGGTFKGCATLTSVDLSGIDTSEVGNMEEMFSGCTSLATIKVNDAWSTAGVVGGYSDNMFKGCTALVGGAGTPFDATHTNYLYARVDGGPSSETPGYFTHSGTATKPSLDKATLTLDPKSFTYNGSVQKPTAKVELDGKVLTADTDYTLSYSNPEPKEVGTYTVTAVGTGNYAGSVSDTFAITKAGPEPDKPSLADARVTVIPASFTYSGKAQKPGVVVELNGKSLKAGTDYTLTCSPEGALEVGAYTLTATGKGNYTGQATAAFQINHVDMSKFTDLDAGAWYMGAENGAFAGTETLYLDEALARGLMSGYKGTTNFGPNDAMSRAMVATVIYRMATGATADEPYATVNTSGLSDVEPNQWYTAAVNWCVENKVITGYTSGPDAGRFCPGKDTTREELATITGRYCTKVAGMPSAGDDVSRFSDASSISGFAREGVAFCVANKVVGGYTDGSGRFDPQGRALRCQGAKIFAVTARLLDAVV